MYYTRIDQHKKTSYLTTVDAKEIARIVYPILKNKTGFNNKFKGIELEHSKYLHWPRATNPNV